jgi:hypothetical protein
MLHDRSIISADAERRRDGRRPMLTYAQLSLGGRVLAMARTIDLSSSGFAGTCDLMLDIYQEIGVGINGLGTVHGTVVWKSGSKFAVKFRDAINVELVDVSAIMQPQVALPNWIPEYSETFGNFAEIKEEEHNLGQSGKMASDNLHTERPHALRNENEADRDSAPKPVRLVTESSQEETRHDLWNENKIEDASAPEPVRTVTESFKEETPRNLRDENDPVVARASESVRIVAERSQEELPPDLWNANSVQEASAPEAVRNVTDDFKEEKPRDPRNKISARIEIRKSGVAKCKADILDISRTGFQLNCALHFNEGEHVFVSLPGMQTLSATAVWHNDFGTGFKFEAPISEYVYDGLVDKMSH